MEINIFIYIVCLDLKEQNLWKEFDEFGDNEFERAYMPVVNILI